MPRPLRTPDPPDGPGSIAARTPDGYVIRRLWPGFTIERKGKEITRVDYWGQAVAAVRIDRDERRWFRRRR